MSGLGLHGAYFMGLFDSSKPRPSGVGRIVMADNTVYEGQIDDGRRNGFGRLIKPSGEHFEGYFRDNMLHGFAVEFDTFNGAMSSETYIEGKTPAQIEKENAPKPVFDQHFKLFDPRVFGRKKNS